jgi:formylglycine-generating enzyme required for sulfatase activity
MAKKEEDRYQDMQEFERALEQLRAGVNIPVARENEPVPTNDDQFATMDTSTSLFETQVEGNLKDTSKPNDPEVAKEQPQSPIEGKKSKKAGVFAGLGALAVLALFFVIGNATNWFRGIQATVTPTVAPSQAPIYTDVPIATPTSALGIGSTMISEKDGMEMVYVPAGTFLMGSPEGVGDDEEHPQHTVYLDAFWFDKTEVTNAMYMNCVAADFCTEPSDFSSNTRNSYYGNPTYADYPVIYVTWFQAQDYCSWAGRESPTEAQWEKAARGEDGSTYPWGDQNPTGNLLNFADLNTTYVWSDQSINDGYEDTSPVGNYLDGASVYGALDMAGNVWEWTADWYDATYYSSSPQNNPSGPAESGYRVLRGGSWYLSAPDVRSAFRGRGGPSVAAIYIGFRCAKSAN